MFENRGQVSVHYEKDDIKLIRREAAMLKISMAELVRRWTADKIAELRDRKPEDWAEQEDE